MILPMTREPSAARLFLAKCFFDSIKDLLNAGKARQLGLPVGHLLSWLGRFSKM